MARRRSHPLLTTLETLTRGALRAQRAARRSPLARAAERAARKAAKEASRQAGKQIRQAGEQWRAIAERALDATREAGQRQAGQATELARQALTGVVTPVDAPPDVAGGRWTEGRWGSSPLTTRRYRLFRPDGLTAAEPAPLLILLHGCGQDSAGIAVSTRVAALARQQRFVALLPEQSAQANAQRCWNWFRGPMIVAQEAELIMRIAEHVARLHPVDPQRVFVAGLSAGAAMALTLALRYPTRIRAAASHSGPVPLSARNAAEATRSMHGFPKTDGAALRDALHGQRPPPVMIVQGDGDRVVDARNAGHIAALWLSLHPAAGAHGLVAPRPTEIWQRGARHRVFVIDWPEPPPGRGRAPYVRLARVEGLDHAWSGGAASQAFSDPRGPDALKLIWQFFRSTRQETR